MNSRAQEVTPLSHCGVTVTNGSDRDVGLPQNAVPGGLWTILPALHGAGGGRFMVNVVKLLRVYGG